MALRQTKATVSKEALKSASPKERPFRRATPTMAPAKRRKPAAKTQANEATTTVQRSAYEDDRAQRVAENAQLLQTLGVEGSVIEKPAKEARKRSEPMRRGALSACLVRISTACMCRKTPDETPDEPTITEPPRRSGRTLKDDRAAARGIGRADGSLASSCSKHASGARARGRSAGRIGGGRLCERLRAMRPSRRLHLRRPLPVRLRDHVQRRHVVAFPKKL